MVCCLYYNVEGEPK
ncbi:MAG: (2Fe-2S)-binding protein [Bacteroidaceae bacterium]|nr:(2Fe-2S)-binding protein [Bacteroidaceae bacterium]